MRNSVTTTLALSLQKRILEGEAAQMFDAREFEADDIAVSALGMVAALYLDDHHTAIRLATRVVVDGDLAFHYINPVRDAAIILSRLALDTQLASRLRRTVFPDGIPRSAYAEKGRHIYDALLESIEAGRPSPKLSPGLVREKLDEGFPARWDQAASTRDRVAIAGAFGRRVESAALMKELLVAPGADSGLSYPMVESTILLAVRAGAATDARRVLLRYFPLWAPGAATDMAPLAPVLDEPIRASLTDTDLRSLVSTPRGGLPPVSLPRS